MRKWALFLFLVPQVATAQEPGQPKGVAPANPAASIAALEQAYAASPQPEILLATAAVYESWPGHCADVLAAYRRFFSTCARCASLPYTLERFDIALGQCVEDPTEEIALREFYSVPSESKAPARNRADASRAEVATMMRAARSVDRVATGRLYVTLLEVGSHATPANLNALRDEAIEILLRAPPTHEGAAFWVNRIEGIDDAAHRELRDALAKDAKGDDDALAKIRLAAVDVLRRHSSIAPGPAEEPSSGCHANPEREFGYLTINTKPWSEIFVNGARHGTTPVANIELLAGCVSVRAQNPVDGTAVLRNITIRPNKVAIFHLDLDRGSEGLSYQ